MPPIGSWTPERVEKLRELWVTQASARAIAEALGAPLLSRNSIISKANRLKLPPRVSHHFSTKADARKGFEAGLGKNRPKKVKAKRVTLPPLPINGPVLTSDTKLLKSAAWLALPGTEPKTLTDLKAKGECRWPIGENPTLFCGCATEKTYCPAHAKVAYKPKVTA